MRAKHAYVPQRKDENPILWQIKLDEFLQTRFFQLEFKSVFFIRLYQKNDNQIRLVNRPAKNALVGAVQWVKASDDGGDFLRV